MAPPPRPATSPAYKSTTATPQTQRHQKNSTASPPAPPSASWPKSVLLAQALLPVRDVSPPILIPKRIHNCGSTGIPACAAFPSGKIAPSERPILLGAIKPITPSIGALLCALCAA